MNRPQILVTGGTGFLGKKVVSLLREEFEVHVLSRSGATEIKGDLTLWNAGIQNINELRGRYSIFLHLAGLYDLNADKADCYQHNVAATGTALKVADLLEIPNFINTSSVAAAINSPLRLVKATDLNFSNSFPDSYSESKALAETVIQNWNSSIVANRINLRLGVLVGSQAEGEIERIDGPYYAVESFKKIRPLLDSFPVAIPLPGRSTTHLPLVPVDACAQAIVQFCHWTLLEKSKGFQSFNLTPEVGLPVQEFYESAFRHLKIDHKGLTLIDKIPDYVLLKLSKYLVKLPEEQLFYLLNFPDYNSKETAKVLGQSWCPEFSTYEQKFWSGYEKFVSNR